MKLSINCGLWNSIFAIPCDVVDKHIKLAGSAQLKVLLFILRYPGQELSITKIASALSMNELDVKDSMQYWIETNVITRPLSFSCKQLPETHENYSTPNDNICDTATDVACLDEKNLPSCSEKSNPNSNEKRLPSRVEKPNPSFVARRINESSEIAFLMQEAEIILSRPISNNDSSTLLMLHDTDGLPVDVILMLMQYAVSVGKNHMKYIEKMAISWAQEEIDTVEKAENKIRALENSRKAWASLEKIIGIEHRSPSSKEDEAANRWINVWQLPLDLIKEAYERCINSKGKYILSYMDGIIKRWYNCGIKTLAQAIDEDKFKKADYSQKQNNDFTSYNIDEYERNYMYI